MPCIGIDLHVVPNLPRFKVPFKPPLSGRIVDYPEVEVFGVLGSRRKPELKKGMEGCAVVHYAPE